MEMGTHFNLTIVEQHIKSLQGNHPFAIEAQQISWNLSYK